MLSWLLPLAMLALTALVAALALYLRAFLFDRFGHSDQALAEVQRCLWEQAEKLDGSKWEIAELRKAQAHTAEQVAELQRTLQETQARTKAEIGELRETLEVQAHRVLSHIAWQEVERFLVDESTPDAEKDFFARIVSKHRVAPR
jgi:septal ring factor EnvC (AmiA/AmiB activator)